MVLIDAGFVDERHRFAEGFDHGRDQKIAAELDDVCRLGVLGNVKVFCPIASNSGDDEIPRGFFPRGDDEEFAASAASGRPNTGAAT